MAHVASSYRANRSCDLGRAPDGLSRLVVAFLQQMPRRLRRKHAGNLSRTVALGLPYRKVGQGGPLTHRRYAANPNGEFGCARLRELLVGKYGEAKGGPIFQSLLANSGILEGEGVDV